MAYKHGVYITEQETSVTAAAQSEACMPLFVGAAPAHLASDAKINEPVLCYSYAEAVAALGYSDDFADYPLCEAVYAAFRLYKTAPVVFINVFDPAEHKADAAAESVTFSGDAASLAHKGVLTAPTVTNTAGDTTYVENTDYTVDYAAGTLTLKEDSAIAEGASVLVTYSYANPSAVTAEDIIGGIDPDTDEATGLMLTDNVFPMFGVVIGSISAPGFSSDSAVAAIMKAQAEAVSGIFKAVSIVDAEDAGILSYAYVSAWKNSNNITDPNQIVCWPKLTLGGVEFHHSTHLASLMASVAAGNDDVPSASPSNHSYQIDGAVNNGTPVYLKPNTAAYLNGLGIVTALNFMGGWKCWGNRTAAYPAVTDPKDSFISNRTMINWISNTLVKTWWQKLDTQITVRRIESVLDSNNIWLNGLAAREHLLGGRVEFVEEENTTAGLMDGITYFHVYLGLTPDNREMNYILEYDSSYISALYAA